MSGSCNDNGNGDGKTTCKEVCTSCKCTVLERPLKQEKKEEKKDNCVATIVGVISLPDNFCSGDKKGGKSDRQESKGGDDCTEVYRDLGECLQKCIVQSSKDKSKRGGKNSEDFSC